MVAFVLSSGFDSLVGRMQVDFGQKARPSYLVGGSLWGNDGESLLGQQTTAALLLSTVRTRFLLKPSCFLWLETKRIGLVTDIFETVKITMCH